MPKPILNLTHAFDNKKIIHHHQLKEHKGIVIFPHSEEINSNLIANTTLMQKHNPDVMLETFKKPANLFRMKQCWICQPVFSILLKHLIYSQETTTINSS